MSMQEQSAFPLSWPTGWPRTKSPTYSRFGRNNQPPSVAQGSRAVLTELSRLGASKHVVISTNVELRRDGLPYSNQKEPKDRGAAVYFTLNGKPRVLACDRWTSVGENLWSIAKTINATRGIERWGSVTTEQAFAGYTALEEKTQASCWDVLGIDPIMKGTDAIRAENTIMDAYRRMARETHPDREGGSAELFSEVVRAKDIALQLIK